MSPSSSSSSSSPNNSMPKSILILGKGELGGAILDSLLSHPSYSPSTTSITVLCRTLPPSLSSSSSSSSTSTAAASASAAAAAAAADLRDDRGVCYKQADVVSASVDELASVFASAPYETVIQAAGFDFPAGTQLKIARAAIKAGGGGGQTGTGTGTATETVVKHFIPWQFGVDYDEIGRGSANHELFDEFLDVREELLRSQKDDDDDDDKTKTQNNNKPLKWNIISSGLFTSFLFGVREFGVVDFAAAAAVAAPSGGGEKGQAATATATVRALGGWENKVTVTDVEGIGRMVAEVVFNRDHAVVEEGVLYIGGETISYGEVADVLEDVLREKGREIQLRREVIGLDEINKRLGNPGEGGSDKMTRYQGIFGDGVGIWWEKERMLNFKLGIHLRGVREWLVDNVDGLLKEETKAT